MAGTLFSKAMVEFVLNTQGALQQLNQFQNKFSGGINTMKTALAGFVGYQGLRGAYNNIKDIVDVADKWQIPTDKVSRLSNLFIEFGGSADEATNALNRFESMSNQLRFHSSGPLRELSAVLRTNLANKDTEGIITSLRSQWPLLDKKAQNEVLNMLGDDSVGLRNILRANEEEYALGKIAASKKPITSEKDAQVIRDLRKNSNELANNLTDLSKPALSITEKITSALADGSAALTRADDSTKTLATLGLAGLGSATALGTAGLGAKAIGAGAAKLGISTAGTGAVAGAAAVGANLLSGAGAAFIGGAIGKELARGLQRNDARAAAARIDSETIDDKNDPKNWIKYMSVLEQAMFDQGDLFKEEELNYFKEQIKKAGDRAFELYEKKLEVERNSNGGGSANYSNVPGNNNQTVHQTINIYGVRGAEDIAPALRSVAMQNISPIQGY